MRCFRKWIDAIGHATGHEARDVATTAIPHKRIEIRNLRWAQAQKQNYDGDYRLFSFRGSGS